jgi:dephospho-CoA kinase
MMESIRLQMWQGTKTSKRQRATHSHKRGFSDSTRTCLVYVSLLVTCKINVDLLVIGLTGSIATGKSVVSTLLRLRHIPVIDADILAREVVAPGTPGLSQIVKSFGTSTLLPDGTLDRKKLGSIIFNDEVKRKRLNGIVHPAVRKAMLWAVVRAWARGERYCVLDVPLLIESGLWKWVGKIVVVYWYTTSLRFEPFSSYSAFCRPMTH